MPADPVAAGNRDTVESTLPIAGAAEGMVAETSGLEIAPTVESAAPEGAVGIHHEVQTGRLAMGLDAGNGFVASQVAPASFRTEQDGGHPDRFRVEAALGRTIDVLPGRRQDREHPEQLPTHDPDTVDQPVEAAHRQTLAPGPCRPYESPVPAEHLLCLETAPAGSESDRARHSDPDTGRQERTGCQGVGQITASDRRQGLDRGRIKNLRGWLGVLPELFENLVFLHDGTDTGFLSSAFSSLLAAATELCGA